MWHGRKTWTLNAENLWRLERNKICNAGYVIVVCMNIGSKIKCEENLDIRNRKVVTKDPEKTC